MPPLLYGEEGTGDVEHFGASCAGFAGGIDIRGRIGGKSPAGYGSFRGGTVTDFVGTLRMTDAGVTCPVFETRGIAGGGRCDGRGHYVFHEYLLSFGDSIHADKSFEYANLLKF